MSLSAHDLETVLRTIWATQLELALDREPCPVDLPLSAEGTMTGIIQISGGFTGAVHLTCSRGAVQAAAARMFGQPASSLTVDDLRDALGELANMATGSVKSLLPGVHGVSLPTVVEGRDYDVTRLDSTLVGEVVLTHRGEPLRFVLYADVEAGR